MAAPAAGPGARERAGRPTQSGRADRRRRLAGIRPGLRAAHDRGERDPRGQPTPAPCRADAVRGRRRCQGTARGDRALRQAADRVPELRAQRQGPLSEGARVRRARPHRRGHRDDGAPDRRESAFRALRRSAVQARRVLLHAQTLPRRRERLFGAIVRLGAGSSYYELALYKLGWTFYKQEFYEEALRQVHGAARLQGVDRLRLRSRRTRRRTSAASPTRFASSVSASATSVAPEAVREYFGTSGSRSYEDRVYSNLGEHYLAQAALRRRGEDLQGVRRALSVPPRRAALQHARRGDVHPGRVPQAGAGVEAGVRVHVRTAGRVLAALQARRRHRRC